MKLYINDNKNVPFILKYLSKYSAIFYTEKIRDFQK